MKTGVHIFTKIKNTEFWKKKKRPFAVISLQKFLILPTWTFLENAQCFVGALLSNEK